ncbi:MAG TPA: bifunctional diaminohydroxyphosphoribosylaminopyrimidine deaminase/5-amino-6-(5-phosphoribosylamino)uracil reductase RibD [Chthoniobacterales bacterium]|nr:bifunctional diaminohydroxyphosphoribosylaminopyrimidine deaminase/5-amino-6-(5-phosphoribosylamino)uracil reductase RibD [Chthoniobacterales bacterium]
MKDANDERFMRLALAEARKGVGRTSPNPAVGAVLVIDGKVIAHGHHREAGKPHAEVECLRSIVQPIPKRAVLYVTLEPCSTIGRTPPCTEALIEAGIANVVVGAIDVNPSHSGRGLDALRRAGIAVRSGVLASECVALNEAFNHWIRTKRPLVIAKCGMSLDGRLTRPPGESRWITSAAARKHANRLRATVDAILIGAETLRADDPRLTVRGLRGARQPWRVVLTRSERLPAHAHLFTDRFAKRTFVFRDQPLATVLAQLGEQEITSVLIEGGGDVLGQALDARLVDRVQIYLGPMLTGGPVWAFGARGAGSTQEATRLHEVKYERIGQEIFLSAKATVENHISE